MTSLILLFLACAKPCEYTARCDGTVLQTCSLGPDQLFGSGESEQDCASTVNPVCHEESPEVAFCTVDPEVECVPDESRCEGDLAITCNSLGFEIAEDCALYGPSCVLSPDQVAQCALDPATTCDDTFERRCEGSDIVTCSEGLERLVVCQDDRSCGPNEQGNLGCLEP